MNPALWLLILSKELEEDLELPDYNPSITFWVILILLPVLSYLFGRALICLVEVNHCLNGIHWHDLKEACWTFPGDLFR